MNQSVFSGRRKSLRMAVEYKLSALGARARPTARHQNWTSAWYCLADRSGGLVGAQTLAAVARRSFSNQPFKRCRINRGSAAAVPQDVQKQRTRRREVAAGTQRGDEHRQRRRVPAQAPPDGLFHHLPRGVHVPSSHAPSDNDAERRGVRRAPGALHAPQHAARGGHVAPVAERAEVDTVDARAGDDPAQEHFVERLLDGVEPSAVAERAEETLELREARGDAVAVHPLGHDLVRLGVHPLAQERADDGAVVGAARRDAPPAHVVEERERVPGGAAAEGGEDRAAVARVRVEEERRHAAEDVRGGGRLAGAAERGGEDAERGGVRGRVRRGAEEHGRGGAEEHRGPGGAAAERGQEGVEGARRAVGSAEEGRGGGEAAVARQGGQQAVLVVRGVRVAAPGHRSTGLEAWSRARHCDEAYMQLKKDHTCWEFFFSPLNKGSQSCALYIH